MHARLSPSTALLLTLPPLMWAGNAVVGRAVADLIPPMTLNLLRWTLAGLILLPLAAWVLRPGSGLWTHWRRFCWLGLLSVGVYNALQYLALKTSSPINVTLVAASMPIWMQLVGRLFFAAPVSRRQLLGALLSISGVLLVLSRGQWQTLLEVHLVPGDVYILIAAICWAFYSWMLARPGDEPVHIRSDWAAFLMVQIVYGLVWSALFAGGEWLVVDQPVVWVCPMVAALVFVAVGPAILAYRAWAIGVKRAGPTVASFFGNLTPLLAAVMSTLLLGELPQLFHAAAFVLIVCGIVVSSVRR
ncbi:MAG: DMT family transporter [bacterium]